MKHALSYVSLPEITNDCSFEVEAKILDEENEVVALVHVTWKLGKRE